MSDKESSTPKKLSVETTELIEQVRARPCLWDRAHRDYRHRRRKERAWAEICAHFEPAYPHMSLAQRREMGILLTRRWYNVRDCYRKSLNPSSRASHAGRSRPYLYADLMTFLDATHTPTASKQENDEQEEPDEPNDQEEWLNEVFIDMEQEPLPKKAKVELARTKEPSDAEDSVVSVLVNLIEKEEDEDRAFFKSITPAVKRLSEEHKFVFRIQVMKLLNGLKKSAVKREKSPAHGDSD